MFRFCFFHRRSESTNCFSYKAIHIYAGIFVLQRILCSEAGGGQDARKPEENERGKRSRILYRKSGIFASAKFRDT